MYLHIYGSSLVSYACYTDDLFSIFELDLPWTKSYLALILFTRCYKGFEPYADYWLHDGNETDGSFIVKYLHRCLGDTGKIKSRIRQLVARDEQGCEADRVLDEMMSETHFSTQLPLSYYECTRLLGTTYLVLGDVSRVFLASSFSFDALEKGWAWGWKRRGWVKADKKPALNPDLWDTLLGLTRQHEMHYHWVKGHEANEKNTRCDEPAVLESRKFKR